MKKLFFKYFKKDVYVRYIEYNRRISLRLKCVEKARDFIDKNQNLSLSAMKYSLLEILQVPYNEKLSHVFFVELTIKSIFDDRYISKYLNLKWYK